MRLKFVVTWNSLEVDESCVDPSGNLLCLWQIKTIIQQTFGTILCMLLYYWADPLVHLLLLKSHGVWALDKLASVLNLFKLQHSKTFYRTAFFLSNLETYTKENERCVRSFFSSCFFRSQNENIFLANIPLHWRKSHGSMVKQLPHNWLVVGSVLSWNCNMTSKSVAFHPGLF